MSTQPNNKPIRTLIRTTATTATDILISGSSAVTSSLRTINNYAKVLEYGSQVDVLEALDEREDFLKEYSTKHNKTIEQVMALL